jgi:hypothetical protein
MRFIFEFHRNRKLSKGINNTFIALIPKVGIPQYMPDFRLIALVGSLYKLLAKGICQMSSSLKVGFVKVILFCINDVCLSV